MNDEPGSGWWLYSATPQVGYSIGAFLMAPTDGDPDVAILVRTTKVGVPSADGVDLSARRLVMDALSPEGHPLGVVQADGPRACWLALVPAIDAYFDALG
jgi:hypothetical protein